MSRWRGRHRSPIPGLQMAPAPALCGPCQSAQRVCVSMLLRDNTICQECKGSSADVFADTRGIVQYRQYAVCVHMLQGQQQTHKDIYSELYRKEIHFQAAYKIT